MDIIKSSDLKGSNRCFFRRTKKIFLEEGKDIGLENIIFQKIIIKNWFLSKSLRGKEKKVKEAISLLQFTVEEEDVPEDLLFTYRAVKSILRHDGLFDLQTGDFDALKALLTVKLASRERYVRTLIEESFLDMGFSTVETAVKQADMVATRTLRYLLAEKRTPVIPETKVLDLFGLDVETKPNLLFIDEEEGSIEAVKIRTGRPDLAKNSRKKDSGLNNNLELFSLWMYAKSMISDDKPHEVKASYYYLRKDEDRTGTYGIGYFDDNAPIRSILETVTAKTFSKIEENFESQIEDFRIGESCSGETCDKCDFNEMCHYSPAPLKSDAPRKSKPVNDIDLSDEQEEAVFFRKGIARVNAGAGAGKTLVVALRTAFMFNEGISPEQILLVTFTDAGASEMRERIALYDEDLGNGTDMELLNCKTFNAFGNDILKKEYKQLGFLAEPRLIDDIERKKIIMDLLDNHHIDGLDYQNFLMDFAAKGALAVASEAFNIIKRDGLSSYDVKALEEKLTCKSSVSDSKAYEQLLNLYELYDNELRSRCLIEYQDQERLLFELLDIDPYYFDTLGYKHIVVDEFQDSSANQIELVKRFIECASFESLMIVGDDSQSIFGFRDACPANIIDFFDKIGHEGKDIFITNNHRSTPEILDFANKLNELNESRIDKDLIAVRASGKPVTVKGFHKAKDEYDYITKVVQEKLEEGHDPEDIAVIAFKKSELMKIAGALTDAGIESSIQAPIPMTENSRVQAIISLAKAYKDKNATKDILVIENCLIGGGVLTQTDEEIKDLIDFGKDKIKSLRRTYEPKRAIKFGELVDEIVGEDDIAKNLADRLKQFRTTEKKVEYIEQFALFGGERIKREGKYSGVVLSTAHSSKGLEWPVVINSVTSYDSGNMNRQRTEEMRRLFFVSSTRARDELYVTGLVKAAGNRKDSFVVNKYMSEAYAITGGSIPLFDVKELDEKKKSFEDAKKRIKKEDAEKHSKKEEEKAS